MEKVHEVTEPIRRPVARELQKAQDARTRVIRQVFIDPQSIRGRDLLRAGTLSLVESLPMVQAIGASQRVTGLISDGMHYVAQDILRPTVRREVRSLTGDQWIGQYAGDLAYAGALLVNPLKPLQGAKLLKVLGSGKAKPPTQPKTITTTTTGTSGGTSGLMSSTSDIHQFPQLTRSYFRDMEGRSGLKIPKQQRTQLKQALQKEKFEKLSQNEYATHNKTYNKPSTKKQIISDWEKNTGQKWPTYRIQKIENGGLVNKDIPAQIHHVIPQQLGGPHEWWNAHPLGLTQHQGGVHKSGAPLTNIVKEAMKNE